MRDPRRIRTTASVLLAAYSLVVIVIVAWPSPVDAGANSSIRAILEVFHRRDVLLFLGYAQVEFLANVAMFVPIGLLVGLVFGRRFWGAAVAVGFALSASIETFQLFLLPGRFATIDDVIANTFGTLLGALVAGLLLRNPPPKVR